MKAPAPIDSSKKNGMGIEIIEKDNNYINFIKSFHNDFDQK